MTFFISKRAALCLVVLLFISTAFFSCSAQEFLTAHSEKVATAPDPLELGYFEASKGVLHLEFELGTYPQRGGGTLKYRWVYDGNSQWVIKPNNFGVGVWTPEGSLWRQIPAQHPLFDEVAYTDTSGTCGDTNSDFNWTDEAGVQHFFPVKTTRPTTTCGTDTPNGDAFATDSSGYHLYVTEYSNGIIYAPDGTQVLTSGLADAAGNTPIFIDSNGNYIANYNHGILGGPMQTIDTTGRTFPQSLYYMQSVLPTSQGTNQTYTIGQASIPVKSAFAQPNVTECTSNCTMTVVQSIGLPDGTSYSFKYDCDATTGNTACGSPGGQAAYYGDLISMTLPTGGQINYTYQTFSDAYGNRSRWLLRRTVGSDSWSYSPQVLTTCAQNTVGCQQQVTVTKPNGDAEVYTFTLNNGAWPTRIQYYDVASNTFPLDIVNSFDFSNSCPLTNCIGAAYIRKTSEVVTVPGAGGNISRKTQFYYDLPQTANIIQILEWKYVTGGAFATYPDRSQFISYLSTGTNNINRVTSITECNNDTSPGTDATCLGFGHRVKQTQIAYDSYGTSSCRQTSGLVTVSGVANHDDTNFSSANTARGNPTQIRKWVSGSTYVTTELFYDTTGQVIQQTDPDGNVTCYDYTDNYFTDNGANPPATTSSAQPTNAYLTSITRPLIGKETYGYYLGSGKEAVFTDQNGASTYSHYADSRDRSTGTVFPIGWNMAVYTAPTQVDTYDAVSDATPSIACVGCRHNQVLFDGLARRVSEKLLNNPGGAITVDTGYDFGGRSQTVSHAYINVSDPSNVSETYTFDELDRVTQVTHPDQQSEQSIYDPATIIAIGGLGSQQGSTATYGIGAPVLLIDEAGVQKQEWLDGFGRVIEVDEPGASFAGTNASGQVSVNGSVRVASGVGATPAQPGTGSVTIQGGERSVVDSSDCNLVNHIWVCTTIYDSGSVTLTVNGVTERCSYSRTLNTNATAMASCLAGLLTSDTASPVTATASSGTISMTARTGGASTNYSFSVTSSWDSTDFGNTAAYTGNPASGALTGGADAYGGTTVYDYGTVSLSVGGFTGQPVGYGSTVTVDVRFTNDSCSACSGTAVGGGDRNLFVNSISVGSTTILPGDPSVTYVGAPCNATSNGVGSLFCNGDMIATTSASGQSITVSAYGSPDYSIYPTMQLLVDGVVVGQWTVTGSAQNYTVTIPTGITTADQVASALAATMNVSGSPVTASASGSVITISYNTVGSAGNATASVNSTPDNPSLFSGGSFSGSTTLAGGQDPSPGSLSRPYVTLYAYDTADNLTSVVQGVQTRTYVYDGLSRVTSQTSPEAGTDTIAYTTSTGALCSGDPNEPCQKTDALGNITTYQYDSLYRLVQKTNSTSSVTYSYDVGGAPAFALGRMTKMQDNSGSETYQYDAIGRVLQVEKDIGTASYITKYAFDADGDLTQITYPSGRVVQQSFNVIGQLCEVAPSSTGCNTAASPYATAYAYDAAGNVTGFNYGNGISAGFAYEPKRLQMSQLTYTKGTQTLFGLNYFYKNDATNCPGGTAGNNSLINCIVDTIEPGRTISYGYDGLRRMTSASTTGSGTYPRWSITENYDRYNNRSNQSVAAGMAPTFSVPFDTSTNHATGYTYDLNGNLTVEPLLPANNYGYDADNRMTSYSGAGGSATYSYDGHDHRMQKAVLGGTSTVYIYSGSQVIAEYDNGALPNSPSREYIYAGAESDGRLLATISSGTIVYHHSDHLSVRLTSDGTAGSPTFGQVIGQQGHFPYGEQWYRTNTTTKWFFTSYERDGESGLDYALGRFYNSRVAAFCTADPYGGNVEDPESWNRYSYGRENPVSITDPDGQFPFAFLIALADFLEALFTHHSPTDFTSPGNAEGDPGFDPLPLFLLGDLFNLNDPALNLKNAKKVPTPQPRMIDCGIVPYTWTGVGPKQALNKRDAIGVTPHNGDVAIDPKNYGLKYDTLQERSAAQNAIRHTRIVLQPDWKNATIPTSDGGTMTPAPSRGFPKIPRGLPSRGPYRGRDVIDTRDGDNRADLYRYKRQIDANRSKRNVPTHVYIQVNPYGLQCPK